MSPTLGRREDGSWSRRRRRRPFRAAAGAAMLLVLLLGSAVLAASGTTSSTPTDGRAGDRRSPIALTRPRPDVPPLAAGWAEIVMARLPRSTDAYRRGAAGGIPGTRGADSTWPSELASRPTARAPVATARSEPKPPPGRIRARGVATWYCLSGVSACHRDHARGLFAAAGPALRIGAWRGRAVTVCAGRRCVRVRLVDWCACDGGRSGRIIDLYGDAFRRLAPLTAGEVRVSVRW